MKLPITLLAICITTGAAPAFAQAPLHLTLDDAIARGLAASHRLAAVSAVGDAARAAADERRAVQTPLVNAQAGYTRTNHIDAFGILLPTTELKIIYPDLPDNYRTRLDLQWPIYTSGRLDALERAARVDAAASDDELASARADLRLEITRAYWALVTATESVHVVDESVARVEAHLHDVRARFGAGLVPPNDVSSVVAQESRQRMLRIQAEASREVAEAELTRLVGAPPGTPIEPTSTLTPPPPETAAMAALVEEARTLRRDRAALAKRVEASTDRGRAASAGRRPTVAVAGGFDYASPNPRIFPRADAWKTSWDAGVNVNWPLVDGGRTRAQVAQASALSVAAREQLADFDAALAAEVRERLSELQSSRAAIAAADDAVLAAADARRVVTDRFKAGVATSTDVLDAQVALLQAELDRTQAIAGARLAEARLARAVGK